ncbi:MAG: N-formylglutamate amidohydrolase [Methylovirgula sp.]
MSDDPKPDASNERMPSEETVMPVENCSGRLDAGVLLVCDHATNHLPSAYGTLGLSREDLESHIAFDIGAAAITRRLALRLDAPAVLSGFSRLLIDANRGGDDPTLVMQLSDGRIIPGNAGITPAEIDARRQRFWQPYRDAIGQMIEAMSVQGPVPAVVSLHSFTPRWRGVLRPWEVAVLWDSDARMAQPLMAALAAAGWVVGDNEPYDGALHGDTLYDHVTRRGLAGLLIETRQDLIDSADKACAFADRLADILKPILARPEMHRVENLQSRTDDA